MNIISESHRLYRDRCFHLLKIHASGLLARRVSLRGAFCCNFRRRLANGSRRTAAVLSTDLGRGRVFRGGLSSEESHKVEETPLVHIALDLLGHVGAHEELEEEDKERDDVDEVYRGDACGNSSFLSSTMCVCA